MEEHTTIQVENMEKMFANCLVIYGFVRAKLIELNKVMGIMHMRRVTLTLIGAPGEYIGQLLIYRICCILLSESELSFLNFAFLAPICLFRERYKVSCLHFQPHWYQAYLQNTSTNTDYNLL